MTTNGIITGAGQGGGPDVESFSGTGANNNQGFFAYNGAFAGGVRVATGDVSGDGIADIVTGAGPGGGPNVKVFNGTNNAEIASFFAYDAGFVGGVNIALGDVNGDGFADIITGAGPGAGPHVKVFSGKDGSLLASFFAYQASYVGGVTVAAADVNGDGKADIITGSEMGDSVVNVFSGSDFSVLKNFRAYDAGFSGGVFVAGGDVNGDGKADIATGAGAGGGPHVKVFSGLDGSLIKSFFAYDAGFAGGVRVALRDLDGDGKADIITGPGPGGGPNVRAFSAASGATLANFYAYNPVFAGGVYVAGNAAVGKPTVTSASPNSAGEGTTNRNITLAGSGFASGAATTFSGTGITVNSTTFVDSSHLTANISIASNATPGARDVTVTNPGGLAGTCTGCFTVSTGPTVSSTSPNSLTPGATNQDVSIVGTGFVAGASSSFSGTGITVNSTTFVDTTHVTANVTVAASAPAGARDVTVTNLDGGSGSCTGCFSVGTSPTVASASPNTIGQGASGRSITIKGTNFVSGSAVTVSGSGVTVNSTTFVDASTLTASMTAASNAATGARTITVTNPDTTAGSCTTCFSVTAPPTVTSTSPSARGQGATSQDITITGTGFASGATASFSGTGIIVNSTTLVDATHVKANIAIASNAPTGARDVTVANPDGGSGTCTACFSVTGGPTVTSIAPASRGQGATNQTLIITGAGFATGATATFSGTGITVNGTSFVDSTHVTANVDIAAAATPGPRDVTVTNTDSGSGTCAGCFTVNSGPTVVSTNPNSRAQGTTNQDITITGTGFVSGAQATFSGTGITVNSTTFVSATTLTANISVAANAPTGARNVTVTNLDAGVGSCTGCFSVGGSPTVASATPSSRGQGATNQNITVNGTNFVNGSAVTFSASGITVNSTTFVDASTLTANITVAGNAGTGAHNVTVTNPDTSAGSCTGCFTVDAGPTVTSTNPSSLGQSASNQDVTITGTGFVSGAAASFSGTGITVNSTTFVDATHVKANVTVAANATAGARNVTVTNPDAGNGSCTGCFTVNSGPAVTSTSPSSRGAGATSQNIVITGTGFVSGATASFSGTSIAVNSTTFTDASHVTANITIASSAATGTRDVTVTNSDTSAGSCTGCFTVNAGPTVTSTSPTSMGQGATNQNVVINGTGFVTGASASFSGTGITVNSTTVTDATHVTANISIASNAAAGARNVTVTNSDAGAGSCIGCFTVTGQPTVTSTSPNSRGAGATSQDVVIAGTNFLTGAVASFSGTGITVNSTTFTDATHVTANISIASNAAAGARNVTVTNADSSAGSCTGCFTVNTGPTVTSTNPSALGQGVTHDVTVSGTGFVVGSSPTFSGTGITVNTATFVNATTLTINVTVAGAATTGARDVTVTNPDAGRGTCTGCFTVHASPTVTAVAPTQAADTGPVTVTLTGTGFVAGATAQLERAGQTSIVGTSTNVTSSTTMSASFNLTGAQPGTWTVRVTNSDFGTGTCVNCFTVAGAAPTVSSTSPNNLGQGATGVNVVVTGSNFANGAAVTFSGTGIIVNSTTFTDTTHVTANVTIASNAATGARDVTVTNADAQAGHCTGCFTVNAAPTVTSTTPASVNDIGPANNVTINGSGFVAGPALEVRLQKAGQTDIVGTGTSVTDATHINTSFNVTNAAPGTWTVKVTNGDSGVGTCLNCFTITALTPTVTSASPNNLGQGATSVNVAITGNHFAMGAVASFSGVGITVNSTTFNSVTQVTANVTIAAGAATGARDITVTNTDGAHGSCTGCFTVNPGPTVTSVSPNVAANSGSANVTVNGSGFSASSVPKLEKAGQTPITGTIVPNSVNSGGTAMTVTFNLTNVAPGPWDVRVTNTDGGSGVCAGCFTVAGAQPTVTSVSPPAAPPAMHVTITVTGTNFAMGAAVSFSPNTGITVNSTTWNGATQVTADITIDPNAPPNSARDVTVTNTDGQSGTAAGAFTVI